MQSQAELRALLQRIDRRGYPAYKDTRGQYDFGGYILSIDHVQGDPFAAPSKVSVRVKAATAAFPPGLYRMKCRRIALCDYLLRRFGSAVEKASFQAKGSGKSGLMAVSRPGQQVLERTACQLDERTGELLLRLEIGFPANGRTVNARELEKILFDLLPKCVAGSLRYAALDAAAVERAADLAEDQQTLRDQLARQGLVAFVADGAVLPRESGVSGRPMQGAVPFESPAALRVRFELPHHGPIEGMGIKKGVTLIVGGGYHGKSTLLKALELGVYDHIAGDGREYVLTDASAVKIRAEDGRSVKKVDISLFINGLPNGKGTESFTTQDASGSTSQAANLIEGLEAGARVLLIDEDTSATNFMIRDELMQRVVSRGDEPITPLIDRIRGLYEQGGVSTILVAGSSGAYFHRADCVLQMNRYRPVEITEFAKREAAAFPLPPGAPPARGVPAFARCPRPGRSVWGDPRLKLRALGRDGIQAGQETIDLRYLEQLVDSEQLSALVYLLKYAQCHLFDGRRSLTDCVDQLQRLIEEKGLAALCEGGVLPCGLAMPRRQEIFACFDRYRGLLV